ncbi:MAG: diguanylate cyclase [Bacillota bacterium]|nr:diguanylate cyclase [Bacillota bacterium]
MNIYEKILKELPVGFAIGKINCGKDGIPCCELTETNTAFRALTGSEDPQNGRKMPEIFAGESEQTEILGEIALNGGEKSFEAFFGVPPKRHSVKVFSPQKNFFAVLISECGDKHGNETENGDNPELTDIVQFLPDAMLAVDRNRRIIIWNKAIEKMTGIPASYMLGRDDSAYSIPFYGEPRRQLIDLIFLGDDDIRPQYGNFFRENGTITAEVFCPALYNNEGAWIYAKASPLRNKSGNVIGAVEITRDINEQRLAAASLKAKTAFLEAQINSSPDGIIVVSDKKIRTLVNRRAAEIFNLPPSVVETDEYAPLIEYVKNLIVDPELFTEKLDYLYEHPGVTSRDVMTLKNGTVLDRYTAPVTDGDGLYYGRIWTFRDITESIRLETALSKEKNLLETTLASVFDGVISADNKGKVMFMNRAAEQLTGFSQDEARGMPIEKILKIRNIKNGETGGKILKRVLKLKKAIKPENPAVLISRDGTEYFIEGSAAPMTEKDGKIIGVVLAFRDFSERQQKQEEIKYLSYHDQLTGLYNRRFYEEEIKRLDNKNNLPLSIIMGDVNGLKLINDSFGHTMGDELLIKVAEILKKGCRSGDIVARLGGDEFLILLPKTGASEAETIIRRFSDLSKESRVGSIDISVSFGHGTKKHEEDNFQEVFRQTEDLMYRQKLCENLSMRSKNIDLIMNTLYEKNNREMLHSKRVSKLCELIAAKMNFDEDGINQICLAGLMHDIGKIGIDENILNKPSKADKDEWCEIKRHSEIGYRILSSVNEFSEIAKFVLEHHERWGGHGYPRGLKGTEISLQARIIAVADAFDAMTTERTYSKAVSEEEAIRELIRCSGTHFDPQVVKVLVEEVAGKEKAEFLYKKIKNQSGIC